MLKKTLLIAAILVGLVIVILGIRLLLLRQSIGNYARYWKQRTETPGQFTYVVLGDSIGQAIGASKPEKGYAGLVAAQVEQTTGKKVHLINLSVSGATLEDLLQKQLPELAAYAKDHPEVKYPDLLTVEIGANDMRTYDSTANAAKFKANYETFLKSLPAGHSVISNMPYFNNRPQSIKNSQAANKDITALAAKYNIPVVDVFTPLQQQHNSLIYAADFFHPNDRGYRIWYGAFSPAVKTIVDAYNAGGIMTIDNTKE